ncbi:hypothetical protein [Mycobacterium avium]|uniref:Uncharacterized protein n=1 Tax=Mycobacterium avium TaxID=1764 RepID=A0A2A2ZAI5_MYCAV|nr:hypothetical protein [Mycobacterium avium]APA78469.1 hypothetical protein KV38_24850 [Mycobacterium avium subsp. hominissuis]MCA2338297.1 hypothetical protein [Mycobacterium avium]MCA4711473.1 hypothetical protein [Mycobacterium avium subsp. hominissuis]MCA4720894.1 hypothetical protein [Mycobacterium avium subsp. hominissuis]MCA4736676.1 hypothetical protein [Mycobacterium avium subsp. hominissuis]
MNAAWPDPAAPLDLAALNGPGGQRYWRERAAARDAAHVEAARLAVLDQALAAARNGFLAPDWRERGLATEVAAAAGGGSNNVWAWLEIAGADRDLWEPGVLAAAAVAGERLTWRHALQRWYARSWQVKAAQQTAPGSLSRWAGFNLVLEYLAAGSDGGLSPRWSAVLDRHSGPWPAVIQASCNGRFTVWEPLAAHALLVELDRLALSFDVGLASGGEAVDWRRRHLARINRWRMPGERERAQDGLWLMSPDERLGRLPQCWLPPTV